MLDDVKLKPLRKNSKIATYRVGEMNSNGCMDKITTYETFQEALKHCLNIKNGDILTMGYKSRLVAYWSEYHDSMRFGFGASEYEKSIWGSQFYNTFDQTTF